MKKIILNNKNINKIGLLLMFYINKDIGEFILTYDLNSNKSMSDVSLEIVKDIQKIVKNNSEIKIYLQGFPRCVFERNLLNPQVRNLFEKQILFYEDSRKNKLLDICNNCKFNNNCKGIDIDYLDKFGVNEFSIIPRNQDLYNLNKNKLSEFSNNVILEKFNQVLEDFNIENDYYLKKKLVYVNSFPESYGESSKERFVYFMFNDENDFNNYIDYFKQEFNEELIFSLKKFLIKANQFAVSYGIMGDDNLRKTFYFTINDLDEGELSELSKLLEINFDQKDLWAIGMDFKGNEKKVKVYYKYKNIDKTFLREIANEFEFNHKYLKFLKLISSNNLSQVLIDYKFHEGKIFAKKIEFSFQHDNLNLKQILSELDLDFKVSDKDMYTICFELYKTQEEKINFYYTLK